MRNNLILIYVIMLIVMLQLGMRSNSIACMEIQTISKSNQMNKYVSLDRAIKYVIQVLERNMKYEQEPNFEESEMKLLALLVKEIELQTAKAPGFWYSRQGRMLG